MRKSEIETYMDAFMEGFWSCFWSCYCTMINLIDDDELELTQVNQQPKVETSENSSKPKPLTGTNVPEPRNVPHAPEKPTKTPMPEVKPTHDKFVELFKEGKLPTDVAKELGVSPATAYNHLNKARQEGEL